MTKTYQLSLPEDLMAEMEAEASASNVSLDTIIIERLSGGEAWPEEVVKHIDRLAQTRDKTTPFSEIWPNLGTE